jgi:hypothetical protein
MANNTEDTTTVRLRLFAEGPPPREHEGYPMEFGLQDKKQALRPGREQPDGSLLFECEVEVRRNPMNGEPRFRGPYVHGPAAEPFLSLSWKYAGEAPHWKCRQKILLGTITWKQIEQVQRQQGCLRATVPSILVRTASIPVEWIDAGG